MPISQEASEMIEGVKGKLRRHYGRELENSTREQTFRAFALYLRDIMSKRLINGQENLVKSGCDRQVHYLSLEFLMGRSLQKNAFNLGLNDAMSEALVELGFNPTDVFETEPDAGLGNGGLGRLAACYLEGMTTLGIPATGYSICYEFGMLKQKIIDGQQVELPDPWLEVGDVWLIPHLDMAKHVRFGGRMVEQWIDGRMEFNHVDYTEVLAVPKDMPVAGYGTDHVNVLRLWDAKSPTAIDMRLFARGDYMKALEQNAMAEVICKILYPEDNHFEGKLLRLRQQYFFVSATIQDIVAQHKEQYGRTDNFHLKHAIQINDTHPTLVIPELMRIFIDEEKMDWDQAWSIVTHTVSYTNHTVLSEALERWPQNIFEMLLPRIWRIMCEINDRYVTMLRNVLHDEYRVSQLAIIWDGQVRMANLCTYTCLAVNGVSGLHSKILIDDVFRHEYSMWPNKFYNVTNGVDHRRWLAQINPGLDGLIQELTGSKKYLAAPEELKKLNKFTSDASVLQKLADIKKQTKIRFVEYMQKQQGIIIDPSSRFDVQAKRLHEYKRQLLNVIHIVHLYHQLLDNPQMDFAPRTFMFGAKAASGYYMAKRIIRLIHSVANQINNDPVVKGRLKVVFIENYRVSIAEMLMPASEVSEQISTAGKEASGTGNMKFMMNGALTVGTLDGANVEISEYVGDDNIFIFGLRTPDVSDLWRQGYHPMGYYQRNPALKRVLDHFSDGFSDGCQYSDISGSLLIGNNSQADVYMLLADFDSYCDCHKRVDETYKDVQKWNKMSLVNIAESGAFASDRSIAQYAKHIWNVPVIQPKG